MLSTQKKKNKSSGRRVWEENTKRLVHEAFSHENPIAEGWGQKVKDLERK